MSHGSPLTWYLISHGGLLIVLSLYGLLCCIYNQCLLMLHQIPYDSITDNYCTWFAVL